MKFAKSVLAFVLTMALVFSLAACGGRKTVKKPWLHYGASSSSANSFASTIADDSEGNDLEQESSGLSSCAESPVLLHGDEEGRIDINTLDADTKQIFLDQLEEYVELASLEEMENWEERAFEDIPLLNAFPFLDHYSLLFLNNVPEGFVPEIEEVKLWSAASPDMQKAVQYEWDRRRVWWKNYDIAGSFSQEKKDLYSKIYQVDPFERYEDLAEIKTNLDDYWAVFIKEQGKWTLVSIADRSSFLLKEWYRNFNYNDNDALCEDSEEYQEIYTSLANHVAQWLGKD